VQEAIANLYYNNIIHTFIIFTVRITPKLRENYIFIAWALGRRLKKLIFKSANVCIPFFFLWYRGPERELLSHYLLVTCVYLLAITVIIIMQCITNFPRGLTTATAQRCLYYIIAYRVGTDDSLLYKYCTSAVTVHRR